MIDQFAQRRARAVVNTSAAPRPVTKMSRAAPLYCTAVALFSVGAAYAQQGKLPTPVQKLPAYPPVACVTPDWRPEPCEDRNANKIGWWQCGNVQVTVLLKDDVMEYRVTGIEKSNNRFTLRPKDELYLNGKLSIPLGEFGKTKPQAPPATTQLPEPVKCLKPDGTEEQCESRDTAQPLTPAVQPEELPPWFRLELLSAMWRVSRPKLTVTDDPGGLIWLHWELWRDAVAKGRPVEILGRCWSACTMVMTVPQDRICFGPKAQLGFHAAWEPGTGKPSESATEWMFNRYSKDIQNWLTKRGGVKAMFVRDLWYLTGPELWEMGYRRCED